MKNNVLVTGCVGFIGFHFVNRICKSNYFNLKSIHEINKKLNDIINMQGIQIIEIKCDFDKTIEFEKKINKELAI